MSDEVPVTIHELVIFYQDDESFAFPSDGAGVDGVNDGKGAMQKLETEFQIFLKGTDATWYTQLKQWNNDNFKIIFVIIPVMVVMIMIFLSLHLAFKYVLFYPFRLLVDKLTRK